MAVSLALAAACNGERKNPVSPDEVVEPPPFPTHFDPLAPLPPPLPPEPDKDGLAYLEAMHERLAEPWHGFLENCRLRLPPEHALNDLSLAVAVHLSIDSTGELQGAALEAPSGEVEFDEAALEVIREAAPFPEPPTRHLSDDDHVHVFWLMARDRRQAGVATANIRRFKWPAERAVPKFLSKGDIGTAASRLLEELADGGDDRSNGTPSDEHLALGQRVAEAALREALTSDDAAAQLLAARTAAAIRMTSAAEGLRSIIDTSVDMEVRARAVEAMGAIGDRGAVQLLVAVLGTAKGSGVGGKLDVSIAAAKALAALGSAELVESTILGWLEASGDEPSTESVWAALVVLSEISVPAALPTLKAMAGDSSKAREIRMAACAALGANATKATANDVFKALRAHFDDPDAAVRATCVGAVARAAENRSKSRFTYWQLIERIKSDRDERVRAQAVRAAAALEPSLFHQELYVLRKEKSLPVLAALAEALGNVPDPLAYKKLVSLMEHESPLVRRAAAASLAVHPDARAKPLVAGLIDDADPYVRVIATSALGERARLVALLDDDSNAVRQRALESLMRIDGRRASLARMLRALVAAPPKSTERARYAAAWLSLGR